MRTVIPEDGVVFDVGAHAGQFAKLFARLAPRGFIYAFEPGSYARFILRIALRLNGIGNVAVLPLALGDRSGVALLTVPVKRSGSYGFGLSHLGHDDGRRTAETEAVTTKAQEEVAAVWSRIDAHLRTKGPYLLGDRYSAADIFCTMLSTWQDCCPETYRRFPGLKRLADLVMARPAIARIAAANQAA